MPRRSLLFLCYFLPDNTSHVTHDVTAFTGRHACWATYMNQSERMILHQTGTSSLETQSLDVVTFVRSCSVRLIILPLVYAAEPLCVPGRDSEHGAQDASFQERCLPYGRPVSGMAVPSDKYRGEFLAPSLSFVIYSAGQVTRTNKIRRGRAASLKKSTDTSK